MRWQSAAVLKGAPSCEKGAVAVTAGKIGTVDALTRLEMPAVLETIVNVADVALMLAFETSEALRRYRVPGGTVGDTLHTYARLVSAAISAALSIVAISATPCHSSMRTASLGSVYVADSATIDARPDTADGTACRLRA